MKVIVTDSADEAACLVADRVERFIAVSPSPALGLATGETMEPVFAELVRRHHEQGLSFAGVHAYLLDEYVGLDPGDQRAYGHIVHRLLAGRVGLEPAAIHCPNPHATDLDAECARYDQQVRDANIGLQLLGIGSNGHIAFNEPGTPLDSTTRVVSLSERTRADNARCFPEGQAPPARAITQGIATISAAAELLLVAYGHRKAHAVARAIEGPVASEVPASALQRHPNAIAVLDPGAASHLSKAARIEHESPIRPQGSLRGRRFPPGRAALYLDQSSASEAISPAGSGWRAPARVLPL